MLQIFKSNQPFMSLVIPFIGALILMPLLYRTPEEIWHIQFLNTSWLMHSWVLYLMAVILVSVPAMMTNRFLIKSNLYDAKNFVPAIVYTLIASSFVLFTGVHPVHLAAVFLVHSLLFFFSTYNQIDVMNPHFRAGFWLGLAMLIVPVFGFFLVAYFIVLVRTRTFRFKEWIALPLGMSIPVIYMFSHFFFLNGHLQVPWQFTFSWSQTLLDWNELSISFKTFYIGLIVYAMIGIYFFFQSYSLNDKKMLTAKGSFIYVLLASVFCSVIALIQDNGMGLQSAIIPFSLLFSARSCLSVVPLKIHQ